MPQLDGIQIVRSKIHGYGGVVTRTFAKGETLTYADGVLYQQSDDFSDMYSLIVPAEDVGQETPVFWDLVDQTRWFNHSCEPNTEVHVEWKADTKTVVAWFTATRDIPKGEEIVYDYGFTADVAEPCFCGTRACKGLIVDDDPANLAKLTPEQRAHLK